MADAMKSKRWSWSTGERGANRVRVYERARGRLALAFYEPGEDGEPWRIKRLALPHSDRTRAKHEAEELAARLRVAPASTIHVTLRCLITDYLKEATPSKAPNTQSHDRASAEMFLRAFGGETEARNLSLREWNRFIRDRRSGVLRPAGRPEQTAVRNRVIAYDLKWLRAVLNWATQVTNGRGGRLLERNPLVGKAFEIPKEEAPRRGIVTDAEYQAMRGVADAVHPHFALALVLAHETGHRLGSIRHLTWSDVDLDSNRIQWRAGRDKIKYEHSTPISPNLRAALLSDALVIEREIATATGWLFPDAADPRRPRRRENFTKWWNRAEEFAEVPHVAGRQWHGLRRKMATELKHLPMKDLCELGGWKEPTTVLTCYIQPDEATQREALEQRRPVRAPNSPERTDT